MNGIEKLILSLPIGGLAQLGERLNGIQEVSGSIPLFSTMRDKKPVNRRISGLFHALAGYAAIGKDAMLCVLEASPSCSQSMARSISIS